MTNILKLAPDGGSSYVAEYQWTTYRFLLSNGNTIDVSAVSDDSWLRDAVLKVVNKIKTLPKDHKYDIIIVGVANLPVSDSGVD